MELRHLRYFVTVAKELSFTRASKVLYIAQPALSQQIKQLEEEIGVSLLIRHGHQLKLTEEGQVFLDEAQKTLNQAQKAINAARRVASSKQERLSIGFVPVAELEVFPKVLPLIKQQQPNLYIEFKPLTCREQLQSLRHDNLDIALSRNHIQDNFINSILIFEEELRLLVPVNHPLAQLDVVPIKKLNGCDFVLSDPDASFELNRLATQFLAKHKITIGETHYSRNILFNINAVGMGLGMSFIPAYTENLLSKNVVMKKTDKPLPRIGLYLNYSVKQFSPTVDLFIQAMKQTFSLQ